MIGDTVSMGKRRYLKYIALLVLAFIVFAGATHAQNLPGIRLELQRAETPEDLAVTIQIILLITFLTLAPAILILLTSFTRIVIVLSLLRHALSTQQIPPNQVLIGLALFLTFFIMTPVFDEINSQAVQPYLNQEISQREAFDRAVVPLRAFMLSQTRQKDIALFVRMADLPQPANQGEVPLRAVIPAFVISELQTAFEMGFMLFIPFLIIDMVVASVLMSMGMLMLPPIMVSLPFKILLFVLVDGWHLLVQSLILSFR
ncbi:MAG: flagellar type III secretion system pore protein FliP [Candidatus Latescibacteria bacterium]|nr:flagellar type III secretion system pore protein FliP [Candidatus Latescibacterota bacterium]